ncbi:hypothetical protein MMC31_000077 [Peltigera leucophlebia]|nr:hypothetical protein [Peltigera leucophlebia]
MANETCCTCARLLAAIPPQFNEKTEKPFTYDQQLDCCGRFIFYRLRSHMSSKILGPFCQTSNAPTSLPQRRHDPPPYSFSSASEVTPHNSTLSKLDELPAYSSLNFQTHTGAEKGAHLKNDAEDVLHFLDPTKDTISSLSLRYNVPPEELRRNNALFADHLLAARRTVLIPGKFYKGGVSLSPRPINGEEDEIKKSKVRRWMVACKVAEYDIALLYLEQAEYDLDAAVNTYLTDELWETEHPLAPSPGGNTKQKLSGRRLVVKFGVSS